MSVEFSDINGKQWALIKERFLEVQEKKSSILISNTDKKTVKDCMNSCAHSDRCQFFSWNAENNICKQYKFRENKDSSFQWKYDSFKYQGIELPYEVKNQSHEAETQDLCINDCYGDSNCIGVNFMENNKECKMFFDQAQENTFFGYNVVTKNENPMAVDKSTKNVILDNDKEVEKPKTIGIENLIAIIIGIVLVIFAVAMFIFYRKNNKGIKERIEEEEEEIINITSPAMSMSSPSALHLSPSLHVTPSPLMVTPSPLVIQRSSTSPLILSPPSILPPTLPPNMPLPVIPQPTVPPPTRPPPKTPLPVPPSPRYY